MNHDDYDKAYLSEILQTVKTIALVGASAKEVRPSYFVMKYMLEKDYQVIPINPGMAGQELLGQMVYASLDDVPVPIDMVDIFRNSAAGGPITDQALTLSPLPKVIWMQLSVRNDEAAAKAEAAGIKVVMDRCPKMEYGKLSGEWAWVGGSSGMISSKKQTLHKSGRMQSLGLSGFRKPD
jgi:predicted CoA-binding protein